MKQLSDLLQEAKADAPPMRLDLDNVVAAGRSRRHRRNTGWALGAVLAVAATIAVPQVLARPEVHTRPVAAPSVSASPEYFSIEALSAPFTVGDLRVEAPNEMGMDGSMAPIERAGKEVGRLWILPPGSQEFPWGDGVSLGSETINGRPGGYFRTLERADSPEYLKWEYADGASAVVWLMPKLHRAQGKAVAEAFRPVTDRPATVDLRLGHVPGGYRLTAVSSGTTPGIPMRLRFLTTAAAEFRLRDGKLFGASEEPRGASLSLSLTPAKTSRYPDGEVECANGECRLWREGDGVLLEAKGLPEEEPEMTKMLRSVSLAEDVPADEAVPASARLPLR